MGDYCRQKELELHHKSKFGRRKVVPGQVADSDVLEISAKKAKTDYDDVIEENVAFLRSNYNMSKLYTSQIAQHQTLSKILPLQT